MTLVIIYGSFPVRLFCAQPAPSRDFPPDPFRRSDVQISWSVRRFAGALAAMAIDVVPQRL